MSVPAPHISLKRLQSLLNGLNSFGFNPQTGGYNRIGYSNDDMAVREWFASEMRTHGLAVRRDGAVNLFGRFGPDTGPCVMCGSHLDTVPEGGAFDGALGVCVALECVRALQDVNFEPQIAIEVVATAEEEGRFGGMVGSQAITGQVTRTWIDQAVDADGISLKETMLGQGLDPYEILKATRDPDSVRAFLELHIEQGPVLEAEEFPIGIAHSVSGVCNLFIRLKGRANHSGTTPMNLRADAFAGLAQVAGAIPALIKDHGNGQSRITIGKVDLHPNFPHTIPGVAEFSVIIRDPDETILRQLTDEMHMVISDASAHHDLSFSISKKSWLPPISLDSDLVALLVKEANRLGYPNTLMPSGAGHDAQTMQSKWPSALVFVPSRNGISHAPEEWTDWEDIEKGAQLMLNALVQLSKA